MALRRQQPEAALRHAPAAADGGRDGLGKRVGERQGALLVMLPTMEPLIVWPSPSCSVPAEIVVPPV